MKLGIVLACVLALLPLGLAACDEKDEPPKVSKMEDVTISGKVFHLELAIEPDTRFKGLSGRTEIAADGGMLFVLPRPAKQEFVMRDCPIPIDIIYLDGSGRIVAMHKMVPVEPPRQEDEKALNRNGVNEKYESRLKRYPSRFAAQLVIELKGDSLDTLKLKDGDKIRFEDLAALKKLAK